MTLLELNAAYKRHAARYRAAWERLLRFPSVGADPACAASCRACAEWLCAETLRPMGFAAETLDTGAQPLVWGELQGHPGAPTVLLYGHYDVQPADPLDAWTSPPFEPTLRDERLYARGAQDNKGQLAYSLSAIDALIRAGARRPSIKILIEGGEESGSRALRESAALWQNRAQADVLLAPDTGMPDAQTPAITMGLRGMASLTVALRGAERDLHSGTHGGIAPNPAQGMAELLAGLHSPDGAVAVAGFYEGVEPPTPRETDAVEAVVFDPEVYRRETGVEPLAGECDAYSPRARAGLRPTLEINGIASGYAGPGVKTIIPALALAKLSARLVPGQNPERVLSAIERHLTARTPRGLALRIEEPFAAGPALRIDPSSSALQTAARALSELFDRPPVYLWDGASIPALSLVAERSGAVPLMAGFGCPEDCIHAPNESFALECFRKGFLFVGRFLSELANESDAETSRRVVR